MHILNVRNVHEALPEAISLLLSIGQPRDSRNGAVLMAPEPVTTLYRWPVEKVIFWSARDANPFFHLMESLWMLGGRRDVAFVKHFAGNMVNYSDDGINFHAAYGHRWRVAFGFDQLTRIAANLRKNPDDRRQVLAMWSPKLDLDLEQGSAKDLPCNLTVHFQVNTYGALDMTVFNRSNDIVWGCYGANAVQFGTLLEYMARRVGRPVGRYWQISDNWHGYTATLEPLVGLTEHAANVFYQGSPRSPYESGVVSSFPLIDDNEDPDIFDQDVKMFLDLGAECMGYRSRFIRRVALPVLAAWNAYKDNEGDAKFLMTLELLERCDASDWRLACKEWVQRRHTKWLLRDSPVASPRE